MRSDDGRASTFDRSSPVHAYWLAQCEGFSVDAGGREGVVEAVELVGDRAAFLVVRFGRAHSGRIPAGAVEAVVPAEELLVLRAAPARPSGGPVAPPLPARLAAIGLAAGRRSDRAVGQLARSTGRGAARAWGATRGTASALQAKAVEAAPPAWRRLRQTSLDVAHGARRLAVGTGLEARRFAFAAQREATRLSAWLAPRLAVAARRVARNTTALAAAAARAYRGYGRPAGAALARRAAALEERARSRLAAARSGPAKPARPVEPADEDAPLHRDLSGTEEPAGSRPTRKRNRAA
jgi:hypothetical protein